MNSNNKNLRFVISNNTVIKWSLLNKTLNFELGLDYFFLGDDEVRHHVVVDLLEEHELVFEIADNEHLDEDNIDDNLENEQTRTYDDYVSL